MKVKKWTAKVRRFFSLNKKQLKDDDGLNGDQSNSNSRKKGLPWSPEDIMDELHGATIHDEMRGIILLMEMGGGTDNQGWVMDFTGEEKIVVARYDVPEARVKSKKAPTGPPAGMYNGDIDLKSLPWVWYKDRKIFSKIESGKLSDMVAFVTGRIAAAGDPAKWEGIDASWTEAKEKSAAKKKLASSMGGDAGAKDDDVDEGEDDENEEDIDEEARIIATYRPDKPLRDPTKKEFWKRHLGTDFLVASYLFLLSSIAFNIDAIHRGLVIGINAHTFSNAFMATFFTFASAYFIKLSYPESIMIMAYRVMTIDPESMSFTQRYFTANEMLIALWFFTGGFVVPNFLVVLWEIFITHDYKQAVTDLIITIVTIPITGVLNYSAMPDAMRANGGRGSSYFFDKFWVPLLRIKDDEARMTFWNKHLGNDGLAGGWIFALIGIASGIFVVPLVILHPQSGKSWFLFWSTIPFSVGSLLLVRASYPENVNTSLLFSDDDDGEAVEVVEGKGDVEMNGEKTPLL